jgi:hypothetical protein
MFEKACGLVDDVASSIRQALRAGAGRRGDRDAVAAEPAVSVRDDELRVRGVRGEHVGLPVGDSCGAGA